MNIKEKFQNIIDKLHILLSQFKKICIKNISDIPIQINRIVVGTNKLSLYLKNNTLYELLEDDLNGLTSIDAYMFYNCSNLKNIIIPNSVTSIGNSAFIACSNLENIIIPNSVTSIGNEIFKNCTSLKNITIPDSVIGSIGHCIYSCTSLESMTIGSGVTSIGNGEGGAANYIGSNCPQLTDIYCRPIIPPILRNPIEIGIDTIHVPIGSGDAYKSATNWSRYAYMIVEDIEL